MPTSAFMSKVVDLGESERPLGNLTRSQPYLEMEGQRARSGRRVKQRRVPARHT